MEGSLGGIRRRSRGRRTDLNYEPGGEVIVAGTRVLVVSIPVPGVGMVVVTVVVVGSDVDDNKSGARRAASIATMNSVISAMSPGRIGRAGATLRCGVAVGCTVVRACC